ncbi:hypothetical protein FUA26_11395 [Seonamhaeicola algicola]|uniref:DUF3379 domain-containing protein n=1 Tax=Seonamhaeicola algicola TaxID=1719036 RepID=A0A5C7AR41_9FLAO|nr:hypothetical protein [Seonamhaeicola algicola]TXE10073.1 hypothetical protein FUA26_11395 [Seonamhaeicola algicola]
MVLNNIEKLIEKYENGETTLNEEAQLKHYFSQETVAPHLEMYKPMFNYFLLNKQEQFTKNVPLKTKKTFNYKWISVAAVAVLMLGFYLNSNVLNTNDCNELGTYCEPEQALNEVSKQLAMISNHFNKGTQSVNYLNTFEKGAATLGYLNEVENTTNIIFKK